MSYARGLRENLALGGPLVLPALIPIATLAFLWGQNSGLVRPADVAAPLTVSVAAVGISQAILIGATRDITRSSLTVAIVGLVLLTFGYRLVALAAVIGMEPDVIEVPFAVVEMSVATFAILLVWWTRAQVGAVASGAAVVAAIFIGLSVPRIMSDLQWSDLVRDPSVAGDPLPAAGPDIYYLVVDGYARADVLAEVYGYSNAPFLEWLQERGFYVANDSLANYTRTHLSLASSLNMRYVDDLPPDLTPDAGAVLNGFLQEPAAMASLQELGYEYVTFETSWWGTAEAPRADVVFETGAGSEFETVFFGRTLLGRLLPVPTWQDAHLETLSHLPDVAEMAAPTVAFAHILLPHPPFVFDASGHQYSRDVELGGSWSDKDAYLAQLQFLNSWLQATIAAILERSETEPVIVIQSDHGPWSTAGEGSDSPISRWERTAILNTYLVPRELREHLYESISPVNTFRLLLSELFDQPLPLLEDRAMFSPNLTDPRIDITQQLRGR
jgi:hypothetical protein